MSSDQPFRNAVLDNLTFCRTRLLAGVTELTTADLDFQPVPTIMSPREQIVHVVWAEQHWRAACTNEERPGGQWGNQPEWSLDQLVAALAEQRERTLAYCATLADADLLRPVQDTRGNTLSVLWVLHHLARHDAHHAGQIIALWRQCHEHETMPSGYPRILEAMLTKGAGGGTIEPS